MKKSIIGLFLLLSSMSLAAADQPNFVFFITDDISPMDLGCYGSTQVKTPNLDKIAESGLVFDNAYLTISSCSPSRNSIITGRYPHNTGAPELHTTLPVGQHTFIHDLKEAGYYTFLSGKNHMAPPKQLGFEGSSDSQPAGSEKWVSQLKSRPKDKPFFFWFASHDAHRGWQPNDKATQYNPDDVVVPPMMYNGLPTREDLTGYYHEVSRTDYYAGELMNELVAQGIVDNTYFIYCSDNGRPFPRCKTYLYDSGIKTPLIITGPGVKSGRTASLVSSIDFSATILELAGINKPETVQGVSFKKTLSDHLYKSRDVTFAERNWHVFQLHERMVRLDDYLYIWNAWPDRHNVCSETASYNFMASKELWEMFYDGKLTRHQALVAQETQPVHQLFNVKADPHQFYNLADDPAYQSKLEQMQTLLRQWKSDTGDSVQENPTPDRQPLHKENGKAKFIRGELPGASRNATQINNPGPVKL